MVADDLRKYGIKPMVNKTAEEKRQNSAAFENGRAKALNSLKDTTPVQNAATSQYHVWRHGEAGAVKLGTIEGDDDLEAVKKKAQSAYGPGTYGLVKSK